MRAREAEGVDGVAGGEVDRETVEHVALVEVLDGIGKVDGVGGVGQECVAQLYCHSLGVGCDSRGCALGGRYHNLVHGIVERDVFIKIHGDLVVGDAELSERGIGADIYGRRLVARTAFRTAHIGASHHHGGRYHR